MADISQNNFLKTKHQSCHIICPSFSSRHLPVDSNSDYSPTDTFENTDGKLIRNRNKENINELQPNDSSGSLHRHSSQNSNAQFHNYAWVGSQPTTSLNSLPAEIILLILSFLEGEEIHRVSPICKNFNQICKDDRLWRMMLCRRFGKHHLDTLGIGQKCKEVYKEKSVMRISIANGFARQGQGSNSFREYDEFSVSGMVLCLNDFYGFYSKATLEGVPRGRYEVIWKVKVFHRSYMRNTYFVARVLGAQENLETGYEVNRFAPLIEKSKEIELEHYVELDPGVSFFQRTAGVGWFELVAPQQLVVDGSCHYSDIGFEIVSDKDSWKTGLVLDYVQLRKVE